MANYIKQVLGIGVLGVLVLPGMALAADKEVVITNEPTVKVLSDPADPVAVKLDETSPVTVKADQNAPLPVKVMEEQLPEHIYIDLDVEIAAGTLGSGGLPYQTPDGMRLFIDAISCIGRVPVGEVFEISLFIQTDGESEIRNIPLYNIRNIGGRVYAFQQLSHFTDNVAQLSAKRNSDSGDVELDCSGVGRLVDLE